MLPSLIYEDDHLLVVNKPAGLNTHAPSPYAGEGLYDWLRHRELRWACLAIIHRLDKETSGILALSKTPLANRSLTAQFTDRTIQKKYLLLTDHKVHQQKFTLRSPLLRVGDKYLSRPGLPGTAFAQTEFSALRSLRSQRVNSGVYSADRTRDSLQVWEAHPVTGKTHQIRVHAAEAGMPILGDTLYGGTPAARVYLHAAELTLRHPATNEELTFRAPLPADWPSFTAPSPDPLPFLSLRSAVIDSVGTNALRLVHGAADARPGWHVEQLGDYLLSQSAGAPTPRQLAELSELARRLSARAAYHKLLTRQVRRASQAEASPKLLFGESAPKQFVIRENGVSYELSFQEGYSVGLFLDQRDNRRRLLTGHIAANFPLASPPTGDRPWQLLNVFAYTCAFSVCAAKSGAHTTSLDLSKRWLEWGKRNFALNHLAPSAHDFLYGDAFDWLRRLAKKPRRYDAILLDPPTFSQSKEAGVFRAEKDYGRLVQATLPLLNRGGVLFASTNAADWPAAEFVAQVHAAIRSAGRRVTQQHYVPQPPDFPVTRAEPAYLKTLWLRVD